jgi:hypothetical protein
VRLLLLLVVALCGLETRLWSFAATPQPASDEIALATPSFIGENYDAAAYDASDSLVAAKSGPLRFTQTTASPMFSAEGSFAGRSISQVADALRSGTMRAADVPVEFIVRDGNRLIVNTRSSLALRQAGIPEAQWNLINRTGVAEVEANITQRLLRNGLGNEGTDVLRITGSGSGASTYRWP